MFGIAVLGVVFSARGGCSSAASFVAGLTLAVWATLRADGLPAHVSFSPDSPCQPYISPKLAMVVYRWFDDGRDVVMTIDPSQLPSPVGVEIALEKMQGRPGYVGAGIVLVRSYGAPKCRDRRWPALPRRAWRWSLATFPA